MQAQSILSNIINSWWVSSLWLGGFFVAFNLLAVIMPCNPGQKWLRQGSLTDILYFFIVPTLSRFVLIFYISIGVFILFHQESTETIQTYLQNGFGPLSRMPVWWQAAAVFLIADVMLYWTHRCFHRKTLWRWHAIHHSTKEVDWLSTYRFHPINIWLSFTVVDAIMLLAGFSPEAVSTMAAFNMIYSAMVHANLNWTFGPFKYIFASPVFHRWHHTAQEEGMNKNFAPTFPLLDIVFGTFYMPEGKLPEHYGVPGSNIPTDFIGQITWPFKNKA
jgi:sterol desaturase/sphingolipid hydroxylase (fatty acid hydroxylase superfamily)